MRKLYLAWHAEEYYTIWPVLNNTDSSHVSLSTCSRLLPATEFNEKIIITTVHKVYQILLTCWHKLWVRKQTAHPNLKCFHFHTNYKY